MLNATPAVRHVILHFDRIENSNQKQRRIESLFKFCNRCVLHVKSLKEHSTCHHPFNSEKLFHHHDENHVNNDRKRKKSENHLFQIIEQTIR